MSEKITEDSQEIKMKGSITAPTFQKKKHNRILSIILGFLFILPALGALIISKVFPTVMTFFLSFQETRIFSDKTIFVGTENYSELFSSPVVGQSLNFTLLLLIVRIGVILLPILFLALGAGGLRKVGRKIIRIFASIPWMMYSPMALGIAWLLIFNPVFGFGSQIFSPRNPELTRSIVLAIDGLSFFGLASGLGITIFLSALKGENTAEEKKQPVKAIVLLTVFLIIGTIALTLQMGTVISLLTGGGPQNLTLTFHELILRQLLSFAQLSLAATIASSLLVIVLLLGIGFSVIVVLSNMKIWILPKDAEPVRYAKWLKIVLLVLMSLSLFIVLFAILPYVGKFIPLFNGPVGNLFADIGNLISRSPFWKSLLNTWVVPIVIVLLIQFPITYFAALGIGALRPLGKGSEWLLLLFGPWLLVTELLLMSGFIRTMFNLELANRFIGLSIPYLINIPMLFVLTIFFKGQHQKFMDVENQPGFFKRFVWPSLPLLAVCLIFSIIYIQTETVWSLAILTDPAKQLLPGLFRRFIYTIPVNQQQTVGWLFALTRIPVFIFNLLILGSLQLFYLPRLGIKFGKNN